MLLWVLSDRLKAEAGLCDLVSAITVRRRGGKKEKLKKRQKREAGDPNEEQRATAKSLVFLRYSRNLRKGYKNPPHKRPSPHIREYKKKTLSDTLTVHISPLRLNSFHFEASVVSVYRRQNKKLTCSNLSVKLLHSNLFIQG